jgi:phosphate transport system permease protein
LVRILRLSIETLAGIPSIIFGLFGMLFFVNILGWGIGLISGVLTLTLMILPTIIRTSEEALKTVAQGLREGSLALGATKMQTVLRVVLPAASPGILTGLLLAMGRAVGETAALIFTMGSSYDLVSGLTSSTRTLAVHIYLIIAEGISLDRAFATATVLILIILFMNTVATKIIGRFNSRSGT